MGTMGTMGTIATMATNSGTQFRVEASTLKPLRWHMLKAISVQIGLLKLLMLKLFQVKLSMLNLFLCHGRAKLVIQGMIERVATTFRWVLRYTRRAHQFVESFLGFLLFIYYGGYGC